MVWPLKKIRIFPSTSKKVLRWLETAWFCHKIVPVWHPRYLRVFTRLLRICRQKRFEPYEAYRLGMFRPDFDWCCLGSLISRKAMTKIQERFNPKNLAELAKNKGLFHYRCLEYRMPVPRLYLLCPGRPGYWQICQGEFLCTREDKKMFLEKKLPDNFVVKPLRGSYGRAVCVFRRKEKRFIDHLDKSYSAAELLEFTEMTYPDGFLVQQKIENHPAIVAFTGCQALQTVRIITFVAGKGDVRLLHAHFKPITKPGIFIDTYIEGMTGNVEVPIEIDSGILGHGNQIISAGRGVITVESHPVTGRSFVGFKLPLWYEARKLVENAAINFLPLRTLGWDVALGPDQPYIIEANVWWDPPNQHMNMNEILRRMQDNENQSSKLNESEQQTFFSNPQRTAVGM